MNGKRGYVIVAAIAIGFIVWTLLNRFAIDPQASGFLGHKTGLKRELTLPIWLRMLDIHIAFACAALLTGALNFSGQMRRRYRAWHRRAGYFYVASVLAVCVTSGYMAPYATGGKAVGIAFNLLNLVWPAMTIAAVVQAKKGNAAAHRRWMIRSYAFCFANLSIHAMHGILSAAFGLAYATGYAFSVFGTLFLLPIAAEIVIRRLRSN